MATVEYKNWRITVFKRDDYICQFCGQRGGKLHADHIKRFVDYPELRLEVSNGRTLCEECHKTTDTYGYKGKKRWFCKKHGLEGVMGDWCFGCYKLDEDTEQPVPYIGYPKTNEK